ncbi:BNR repeat-like domain-containing protein [Catalinimonas alkaloidigena]|uniref:BNR repeat-like domain-containing protein n=1 Tax=Catalinimonas alkaloidigena TaxID=1075417 RepID=A0A1G9QE83_9BACT|nr:exo-alpha-sialidase [Catalinimonas alkaloidigena]SDM09286.1 BNR repeat-like domain-containing protein [Catalinimonas alkaloidigena]
MNRIQHIVLALALGSLALSPAVAQQDTVHYVGSTLSNVDYHHGQLRPAIGVHNIQVLHANRENPSKANGGGWTYNHAPNLAYWNNTFFLAYLSDPVGEHIPPSQSLLITSADGGDTWSEPDILFPPYPIPDGTTKEGVEGVAKDLTAVMHQRMSFFVSENDRLLSLGYYGLALDERDDPNDGKGVGRVVREIKKDGSFGPVYFIRYNSTWDPKKSEYPFFTKSKDKGFVKACKELLDSPLMMQQWVEEADRDDPLIPLKGEYKAFSFYHLPDDRVVGLWKHALTTISEDGGKTWLYRPTRAPQFVNSNAKIWGQRTSDGKYATVYNPSEFRWPLAISTSDDGLAYDHLWLVNGEITPMRYGGNYKSYGPQYVRGIVEGNGTPPDGNLWVTYSMNKEDMWVASIPVPVTATATEHPNEVFNQLPEGEELNQWNLFSPQLARTQIESHDGKRMLALHDQDRFDYGKAERVIPASKQLTADFTIIPAQNDQGSLQIEFLDAEGSAAIRLQFDPDGTFYTKAGYRQKGIMDYQPNQAYDIRVTLDTDQRLYTVYVNGKQETRQIFFAPIAAVERIAFRTGDRRYFPTADTPTDQMYDLPRAGEPIPEAVYFIESFQTQAGVAPDARAQAGGGK